MHAVCAESLGDIGDVLHSLEEADPVLEAFLILEHAAGVRGRNGVSSRMQASCRDFAGEPRDGWQWLASSPVLSNRPGRSEVQFDLGQRLCTTDQHPSLRRLIQGFRGVLHATVDDAGLAGVAHTDSTRPSNGDIASLGKFKQAPESRVPGHSESAARERDDRPRAFGAVRGVWSFDGGGGDSRRA